MISAEDARKAMKDLEPALMKDELRRINTRVEIAMSAGLDHFQIPFDICGATEAHLKSKGYKLQHLQNGEIILRW